MKKLIFAIVFILILVFAVKYAYNKFIDFNTTETAKNRVNSMLDNLKAGQEQEALCQWAVGAPFMAVELMRKHTGAFDDFKREGGIYDSVENYDIKDIKLVKDEGEIYTRVSCAINGEAHTMIVQKDTPIEWEE